MSKKLVQLSNQDATNTNFYFTESFQRKNHTPFSLEMKKIEMTQVFNYGQNISFDIPMNGDLLHRCFFEVEKIWRRWDILCKQRVGRRECFGYVYGLSF